MKLVFCGDCLIHDENCFKLSNELIGFIRSHDYGICNLEGPIKAAKNKPILKAGPHVFNSESAPGALKNVGFNVVALANNHIMDYGVEAFEYTTKILKKEDILVFGAGNSVEETYEPLILYKDGEEVCIINVAQAEFGVMKNSSIKAGYAWINHPVFRDMIVEQKKKYDKVIVFAHCGLEGERLPLPEWKRTYHSIVDITKSPLISTHPHIVQGYEEYNGSLICYSLGNFYFENDSYQNDVEWNRSLLISLDTITGCYEVHPVSIQNGILDFDMSNSFMKELENRCNGILDDNFLEQQADLLSEKYWEKCYSAYYSQLMEGEKVQTIFYYLLKAIKKKLMGRNTGKNRETMLLHNLQIETHRWIVERFLYNMNTSRNGFQVCYEGKDTKGNNEK